MAQLLDHRSGLAGQRARTTLGDTGGAHDRRSLDVVTFERYDVGAFVRLLHDAETY